MNERYRRFLDSFPGWKDGRRALVRLAREKGITAAARESGAARMTVFQLVKDERDGVLGTRRMGHPPLSLDAVVAIVMAKLTRPELSTQNLKKAFGLPYGHAQMDRILRERELSHRRRELDPVLELDMARVELMFAKRERDLGMTRGAVSVERARAKLALAKRRMARWMALPEGKRTPSEHAPILPAGYVDDD